MQFTHEHLELQRTLKRFIDTEISPHIQAWEDAQMFPAKEVFRKMGALGLLGVSKPTAYGGLGLDYSYAVAMAETLGHIACGGVPLAIGVQTDMATPALARFGSDELRAQFLAPGHQRRGGGLHRRVGTLRGLRRGPPSRPRRAKMAVTTSSTGSKMWITNSLQADWMCLLANTSDASGGRRAPQQVLDHRADEHQGRGRVGQEDSEAGHARQRHRP